jgi:hypothetical protein
MDLGQTLVRISSHAQAFGREGAVLAVAENSRQNIHHGRSLADAAIANLELFLQAKAAQGENSAVLVRQTSVYRIVDGENLLVPRNNRPGTLADDWEILEAAIQRIEDHCRTVGVVTERVHLMYDLDNHEAQPTLIAKW